MSGVTGPRWAVEEPRLDRLRNLLEHRKGQSRSQSGITQVNKCDPLVDDPNPGKGERVTAPKEARCKPARVTLVCNIR